MANHAARVEQRPLGVVGVIGPWNYPLFTPNGSIAYALAAGNAVVFKPSEHTPAVGRWYVEAFAAANPDAPRRRAERGCKAVGRPGRRCAGPEWTSSRSPAPTATGKKIMATCAETLTPVLVECGGKDALIVAADADLTAAADAAAWGAMSTAGRPAWRGADLRGPRGAGAVPRRAGAQAAPGAGPGCTTGR
ncbi:aldehyde dehydrogenase family protein [Saccharopolyspora gregorii]|uniref:Aldehyde dehydrogenase domain-containing protein n=1 Tax=Saccharopolyspora gregorii TaxID=33914 RepID=A0ABP6S3A4_9PSEU